MKTLNRVLWFGAIWLCSVLCLAAVAYTIRLFIM
ncbi:DUF2474 family protein [Ruegeria arenilitoris]|nr:DUF2474 family protein [Ruegeria arenilitoris]